MFDVGYFPPNTPPTAKQLQAGLAEWLIKTRYLKTTGPLRHTDDASTGGHIIGGRDMIRIIAKLFAFAAVLTICFTVQSRSAGQVVAFVSATGSGTACTQAAPCTTIEAAAGTVIAAGGRILCATPVEEIDPFNFLFGSFVFDCPSASWLGGFNATGSNVTLKFQHIGFSGLGNSSVIQFTGSGTLIFDDCVFEDFTGTAIEIEPNGPLNLVITNSRISNNASGVLIKPAAGGSVTATLNGVTIADNTGGGLKTDTTNGLVSVDISNSTINNNAGNGLNAVSGAGGANMFNIRNSVIARNGSAGVQANGASAAALVNNTLLDSNTAGATSAIGGGRILTYGNNSTIGPAGSGFTGTAPLN
jgi:hypothetical protein